MTTTQSGVPNDDTTDERIDGEDLYCPVCGEGFAALFDRCPDDGARLIRWKTSSDALLGSLLDGRFRVVRPLGAGTMGLVYEGLQISVDRPVAIKVIHDRYALSSDAAKRFMREARVLTSLTHPNIVNVYEFGRTDAGVMYLVMELLRGTTLADELARRGPFEPGRACEIAIQLCEALAAAHACGIVHRDLKPANVVLVDGGRLVKVLDFGLAKSVVAADRSSVGDLTQAGVILGTPLYLSPEALSGDAADPRMDLYALGCVLHELLAGQSPFANASVDVVLTRQLIADPPRLPSYVSEELAALVDALLAKSPEARPASAAGVAAQLRAIVGTAPPLDMDESTTLVAPPKRPTPRRPEPAIRAQGTKPPRPSPPIMPVATSRHRSRTLVLAMIFLATAIVVFAVLHHLLR